MLFLAVVAWRLARCARLLSSRWSKSCALSLSVVATPLTPCEDEGSGSSSGSLERTSHHTWQYVVGRLLALLGGGGTEVSTCALLLSSLGSKSCALSLSVLTPCEDEGSSNSSSSLEDPTPHLAVRVGGSAGCSSWRWRHGGWHVVLACCPRSGQSLALSPSRWWPRR